VAREKGLELILQHMRENKTDLTFLTGDFNAYHSDAVVRYCSQHLENAAELAKTKLNERVPTFHGWHISSGVVIDYIFFRNSANWGCLSEGYEVITEYDNPVTQTLASDHRPIVATFSY